MTNGSRTKVNNAVVRDSDIPVLIQGLVDKVTETNILSGGRKWNEGPGGRDIYINNVPVLSLLTQQNRFGDLEEFLKCGCDANVSGGHEKKTALFHAENREITKLLLDYGADPDAKDSQGITARQIIEGRGFGDLLSKECA